LNRRYEIDIEQSNPQSFQKAVWLMMVSHQTEFGCKGITSAEDSTNDNMTAHCDLDLEDSKAFFYLTLAHNDTFPYYIWLRKVVSFRRYHPGKQ